MYVQLVTYALDGISESDYLDVADDVAPRFAALPGLQAKVWLEDPDEGRYGALYVWDDRESMERFLASDLFEVTNPEFDDVFSEGFSILENLTAQTQPGIEIVPARRPPAARPRPSRETKSAASARTTKATGAKAGGARKVPVRTKSGAVPASEPEGGTAPPKAPTKATAKATRKGAAKAPAPPAKKAAKGPAKGAGRRAST